MAQFIGSPCGKHSSYTFYKAFKYRKKEKFKILTLGQFFFVQISDISPVCVAELQLLWQDTQSKEKLSSTKLYFLPESTPEGRLDIHGQDELLAVSDKLVLKLDDLAELIRSDVTWVKGHAVCASKSAADGATICRSQDPADRLVWTFAAKNRVMHVDDVKREKQLIGDTDDDDDDCPSVTIISFPMYCRYRALAKRLRDEGGGSASDSSAMLDAVLGGFTVQKAKHMFVMFCRDLFDYPELFDNDKCCHNLAPILKGRPRKKKRKSKRSVSPSSESNDSVESKASVNSRTRRLEVNGLKKKKLYLESKSEREQEFYNKLFQFMEQRNSPIDRIPHLGFKQIDLFFFYSYAKKMGGYDKICERRLWKHMYDELGGCQGSTSAATCTRRHYEKLLLPFERAMDDETENVSPQPCIRPEEKVSSEKENDDDKQDSDKQIKGESESESDRAKPPSVSDQDSPRESETSESITVVKVEPESDNNQSDVSQVDDRKRRNSTTINCVVTKKPKEEQMVEKEKKWEEIRKKNALARVKNASGGVWPTRVHKKATVAATMQLQRMESSSDLADSNSKNCGYDNQRPLRPISLPGQGNVLSYSPISTARPSVIQHTPLAADVDASHPDRYDEDKRQVISNHSITSLKSANILSPWKTLSVSQLPPPSLLLPRAKNSSPQLFVKEISNKNSSISLTQKCEQTTPQSAHQSSSCSSIASHFKNAERRYSENSNNFKPLENNQTIAHQSSYAPKLKQ